MVLLAPARRHQSRPRPSITSKYFDIVLTPQASRVNCCCMTWITSPYSDWARQLKASADPLRLLILRVLRQQSYGVLELCRLLDIQQSRLSHHLKLLTQAGLLSQRREGNAIFYQRTPTPQAWAVTVFDTVDTWELPADVAARRTDIEQERRRNAEEFFTRHARDFRERQDLIAEYPQYGTLAEQMLDGLPVTGDHALEVGSGLGEFLEVLARRFRRVDALDISHQMLARAQERMAGHTGVHFTSGTLADWQQQAPLRPELIVYNMVLHHVSTPEEEILRAGESLRPGGWLMITDLCRHEQTWAREHCGDRWLGFAPEALEHWAGRAGLLLHGRHVSALRNGFQVQCLIYQTGVGPAPADRRPVSTAARLEREI